MSSQLGPSDASWERYLEDELERLLCCLCGSLRCPGGEKCSAWGKTCQYCRAKGHHAVICAVAMAARQEIISLSYRAQRLSISSKPASDATRPDGVQGEQPVAGETDEVGVCISIGRFCYCCPAGST